jgi:hypothetical protein
LSFQAKVSVFLSSAIIILILLLTGTVSTWLYANKKNEIYDVQALIVGNLLTAEGNLGGRAYNGKVGHVEWQIYDTKGSPLGIENGVPLEKWLSAKSFERLKRDVGGRDSFEATAQDGGTLYTTAHFGKNFLLLAWTPAQVLYRYLWAIGIPLGLFLVGLIFASIQVSRWASKLIFSDLAKLMKAFANLQPDKTETIDPDGFSTEFRDIVEKTNTLQDKIRIYVQELKTKAKIENELELARVVQKSLFPAEMATHNRFAVSSRLYSADQCSGDWYYFSSDDKRILAVLADVTGHGISSAIVASVCRGVWPAVEKLAVNEPHLVLAEFNRTVSELSESEMFMTMVAISVDLDAKQIHLASASHEAPILINKDGAANFLEIPPGPRLGSGRNAVYHTVSRPIASGDSILIYSDGIFELSHGNRKINDVALLRLLQKNSAADWMPLFDQKAIGKLKDDISILQLTVF